MMSDDQVRLLVQPLRSWFPSFAVERDFGRGAAFPTTDADGNALAAGDRFFRSDLGFECYYDGTRWLTVHEYCVPLALSVATAYAATTALAGVARIRNDYAPYITWVVYNDLVATTNDGTKNWTIAIKGYNVGFTTAATIDTFTTGTQTPTTWTAQERAPNTTATPTAANAVNIALDVTKNSTPGNLQVLATFYYRLIIT